MLVFTIFRSTNSRSHTNIHTQHILLIENKKAKWLLCFHFSLCFCKVQFFLPFFPQCFLCKCVRVRVWSTHVKYIRVVEIHTQLTAWIGIYTKEMSMLKNDYFIPWNCKGFVPFKITHGKNSVDVFTIVSLQFGQHPANRAELFYFRTQTFLRLFVVSLYWLNLSWGGTHIVQLRFCSTSWYKETVLCIENNNNNSSTAKCEWNRLYWKS